MVYPDLSWDHSWNQRSCRSAWGKRWCSTYTAGKAFQHLTRSISSHWGNLRQNSVSSVGNGSTNHDDFSVETSTRRDIRRPNGDRHKRPLVEDPTLTSSMDPDPKLQSWDVDCKDLWILWFFVQHSELPTFVVVASAGLGLHTPRRSRCLWPLDHQKSLPPGFQIHQVLVVVSMLCRFQFLGPFAGLFRQFAGQRNWFCFVQVPECWNSLFTGRPAKIHTQCLISCIANTILITKGFLARTDNVTQFQSNSPPCSCDSSHVLLPRKPPEENKSKRFRNQEKFLHVPKMCHGLNLEVRNDKVDPPVMKHVPRLFVVVSWVLKKHVKISGLQRITSDLRQEVFYKKRTWHQDLPTRNTKSIQKSLSSEEDQWSSEESLFSRKCCKNPKQQRVSFTSRVFIYLKFGVHVFDAKNLEKSPPRLSSIVAPRVDLEEPLRHPSPHTKVPTWGDGSRDESWRVVSRFCHKHVVTK